jgi:hypothetical protein
MARRSTEATSGPRSSVSVRLEEGRRSARRSRRTLSVTATVVRARVGRQEALRTARIDHEQRPATAYHHGGMTANGAPVACPHGTRVGPRHGDSMPGPKRPCQLGDSPPPAVPPQKRRYARETGGRCKSSEEHSCISMSHPGTTTGFATWHQRRSVRDGLIGRRWGSRLSVPKGAKRPSAFPPQR